MLFNLYNTLHPAGLWGYEGRGYIVRYAAIDIGTNSCRLLICEKLGDKLLKIDNRLESTRLGQGVNLTARLDTQAIARTCECLARFRAELKAGAVDIYRAVATSAVRDSANWAEFIEQAKKHSQIEIEIINGEKEAYLSYLGVKKGLRLSASPLVVDLGGGSTEFILNNGQQFSASIQIGAVRSTESNMSAAEILERLNVIKARKESFQSSPLVFVGGTATTMAAVKLSMEKYNPELIQGHILTRREIADLYKMLERMPLSVRRRLPGLQPERADIITKGALIMLLIVDILDKQEITVSESDLLEGIIWEL